MQKGLSAKFGIKLSIILEHTNSCDGTKSFSDPKYRHFAKRRAA